MTNGIRVEPLPGLCVLALRAEFASPMSALPVLPVPTDVPVQDDGLRTSVRDMLRQRGYRPTGRGKPSHPWPLVLSFPIWRGPTKWFAAPTTSLLALSCWGRSCANALPSWIFGVQV